MRKTRFTCNQGFDDDVLNLGFGGVYFLLRTFFVGDVLVNLGEGTFVGVAEAVFVFIFLIICV